MHWFSKSYCRDNSSSIQFYYRSATSQWTTAVKPKKPCCFHVVFLSMLAKLPILFEHSPILPIWNILIRWIGPHRWKVYVQDDTCFNCWRWNYFKFNKLCSINLKLQQFCNSKSNQFEKSQVTFTKKRVIQWFTFSFHHSH
jgi:hypothetical protein